MMKWKVKPEPNIGTLRVVKKFLFFPKKLESINGLNMQVRWLERASYVQEFKMAHVSGSAFGITEETWVDIKWA
jgi:hypothetical protein